MTLAAASENGEARLAIRPYPQYLEEQVTMKNGEHCLFRPILPEDEPLLQQFISQVTKRISITVTLARSTNLPMMI